jgi:hypothetical protein
MSAPATGKSRSTWNGWPRVQVHPGAGVVDRRGDTLLVVPVLRGDQLGGARALVELCRRGETGSPVPLDAVHALLERHGPEEMPGFALLVRDGGALRVFRSGPVRVLVDGRAPAPAGADDGRRLAEHLLADDGWREVTVTADGAPADAETALPGLADALSADLTGGTVPGSGVTLLAVPDVRAPEEFGAGAPAAAGPVTALRPAVQFRTILLGECAARTPGSRSARPPARAPLPIAGAGSAGLATGTAARSDVLVEGVLCAAGHFTDPDLPACPTCGAPRHPDDRRVTRPRPPLGILVTDGGTIYTVTGDVVIGREAASAPEVLAGSALPLLLRDEARSTSRVHARLTVRGWKVLLRDNASANGTFLSRHGAAGPWLPVPPQAPLPLVHGDRLRLGRRQLLYDAWREAVVPEVFR